MAEEVIQISEQVSSGMSVTINLAAYFANPDNEMLEFYASELPPGLNFDSNTGLIIGRVPIVVTDAVYTISVSVLYGQSQKILNGHVELTIQAENFVPESVVEEALFTDILQDTSYLDATRKWELEMFVEHFIREHFAAVKISNAEAKNPRIGKFISQRTAKSGWTILNFENYLMITPGNMAFEEGNRGRLIATLEQVYKEELPQKAWKKLRLDGSNEDIINKAWLVAVQLGLNVGDAPSDTAIYCYRNLEKLKQIKTFTGESPNLPG